MGLLSLAAKVPKSYCCTFYTPQQYLINQNAYKEIAQDIIKQQPSVVGFSTWCISYASALLIAEHIKRLNSGIYIVFGGPQASIVPTESLKLFPFIDFIICGEADYSFDTFLIELSSKHPVFSKVKGLYYRNKQNFIRKNNSIPPQNLDELPTPAYHYFPKQKTIKLDVGRGCPFHCTYCSTNQFFSKSYRVKSVDRIIAEMRHVYSNMGIRHFGFAHDMFTLNQSFVIELCDKLIEIQELENIHFVWTCSARIDCVSPLMLTKMKKAGCQTIFFGIESGSERIQKLINKNISIPKVFEIANLCGKNNMNMRASFILGFPQETSTDIEHTLQTILKLTTKGIFVQSTELSLLPGTELFKAYSNQLKFDGIFSSFSQTFCSSEELKLIRKHPAIFSSFYYLPIKSLSRKKILLLNNLINTISLFRKTIMLINAEHWQNKLPQNLLKNFNDFYPGLKHLQDYEFVSFWIKFISNYIKTHSHQLSSPYLIDTFKCESISAVLKTKYSGWQLIHKKSEVFELNQHTILKPTPVWQIVQTKFSLKNSMSYEDVWELKKDASKPGQYFYLFVAISRKRCTKHQINEQDIFLLNNLTEQNFGDFKKTVKTRMQEDELKTWILNMHKIGALEFSSKQ